MRFFASGGARLDPKVAKGLSGLGFKILEGYGLTETSPIVTFNPVRKQKFGSVGMVIPDVEIKILNPDKNKTGEVLIKGPNVMKGYYKRPKETEEVLKSGWFYSGDFGHIDKDGYLFLTGRLKEIIVLSSGKNIYPEEIETHYQKSPFIKELCVLGILKEGATEELGAVIVPDAEHFKKIGEVNIREKIKWELETLSKEIAAYKRIMGFTITKTELPRTRLGKIKRYEVEKVYKDQFADRGPQVADHRLNDGTQVILNTDVGKKVVEFLIKAKGIKKSINADDHLELDLGIDSLGRVELAVGLEKVFGIGIPDEDFSRIFTVKDIIEKISEFILKKPGSTAGREVSDETMWKTILQKDPKEDIKAKIDLAPNFFAKTLAFLGTKCLYVIFKIFFRLKIEGVENIPKEGPFILCPNHSSYLDAFIVAASVPHKCELNLFFMGFKAYFIQPVIKNLIRLMRVIPVDPAAELIGAMQASAFVIHNKKSLCIFPEGKRSIDGEVKELKKGIGILAKELNVTLVPVYIKGAFLAWPRGQTFPKPHPIKITFGKPIEHPVGSYEKIAHFLREALLAQTA
ncbi:MAG: AMP-binding protein [Candidatus Omnitrophica bacterium]|nr:AMP-binding protein [Candidatus Omnitrophota bacterium]